MKKIALVGAVDRNNYGDLLFPVIFKQWMKKNKFEYEYDVYGSINSDLSTLGALPTESIDKLYQKEVDAVVLVGGAILSSTWTASHLHILTNRFISMGFQIVYKMVGIEASNSIARNILHGKTLMPWIIPQEIFKNETKVIYNTGSGTDFQIFSTKFRNKIVKNLNDSSYLSVRDPLSKNNLESMGVKNVNMAPDSAIIMSEIYPVSELENLITKEAITFFEDITFSSNYICFQIANKYAKGFEDQYIKILEEISEQYQVNILLLPIGRANLHDDQIPLQKIYERLSKTNKVYLVEENTIYDTMLYIAKSKLFIGTSLHGNITAISYGVKNVGLDKRVKKLKYFQEEFCVPGQQFANGVDDVLLAVQQEFIIEKEHLESNRTKIIKLANDNFQKIAQIIGQ